MIFSIVFQRGGAVCVCCVCAFFVICLHSLFFLPLKIVLKIRVKHGRTQLLYAINVIKITVGLYYNFFFFRSVRGSVCCVWNYLYFFVHRMAHWIRWITYIYLNENMIIKWLCFFSMIIALFVAVHLMQTMEIFLDFNEDRIEKKYFVFFLNMNNRPCLFPYSFSNSTMFWIEISRKNHWKSVFDTTEQMGIKWHWFYLLKTC